MRACDTFQSFPSIILVLAIVNLVGPSVWNIILVIGGLGWASVARLVYSGTLSAKKAEYVEASRVLGATDRDILFRTILPNVVSPVWRRRPEGGAGHPVGVQPELSGGGPAHAGGLLGNMAQCAMELVNLTTRPWAWIPPGLCIVATALALPLVGEGLQRHCTPGAGGKWELPFPMHLVYNRQVRGMPKEMTAKWRCCPMRKTKIICTLGPSTDSPEILEAMMKSGMDVARFNFSHGTHEDHKRRLEMLKDLRKKLNIPVAALLDTKGPEIRLKTFEKGEVYLETGQHFTLTAREVTGTREICGVTYKNLAQDVRLGSQVMLDDGLISMKVVEKTETDVICRVENGGAVKDRKGVNVPGVHLSMPYMSAQDRADIRFGIEEGFDFIAASFCRTAQDAMEIRRMLDENHSNMRIIAKLENQEGVNNVDEILAVVDGVMIARGDMGVEIDFTEIPVIQKDIIAYTLGYGKHVITATQMLDSMITNPRPTRAEITDVANAVYDGTSAIMLSGKLPPASTPWRR